MPVRELGGELPAEPAFVVLAKTAKGLVLDELREAPLILAHALEFHLPLQRPCHLSAHPQGRKALSERPPPLLMDDLERPLDLEAPVRDVSLSRRPDLELPGRQRALDAMVAG